MHHIFPDSHRISRHGGKKGGILDAQSASGSAAAGNAERAPRSADFGRKAAERGFNACVASVAARISVAVQTYFGETSRARDVRTHRSGHSAQHTRQPPRFFFFLAASRPRVAPDSRSTDDDIRGLHLTDKTGRGLRSALPLFRSTGSPGIGGLRGLDQVDPAKRDPVRRHEARRAPS